MCFPVPYCWSLRKAPQKTHTNTAFIGADKARSQPAGHTTLTITLMLQLVSSPAALCVVAAVSPLVCACACETSDSVRQSKVSVFFFFLLSSIFTDSLSVNLPISLVHVPSPSHLFPSFGLLLSLSVLLLSLFHLFPYGCFAQPDFPYVSD